MSSNTIEQIIAFAKTKSEPHESEPMPPIVSVAAGLTVTRPGKHDQMFRAADY